jgi:EAL domain-containing protein (putative c-di-GMP-specific phosphodiesterase class I)/GGDEF domain-containing protein
MKKREAYLLVGSLLVVIIIRSIIYQELFIGILTSIATSLLIIDYFLLHKTKIVIAKEKIKKKYHNKTISHYYVMFIEIGHLPTYSQFFDIKLADHIALEIYQRIQKHTDTNVFMYGVNQLVVIGEFENKNIINQKLRYNEKMGIANRFESFIHNKPISIEGATYKPDVFIGISSLGARDDISTIEELVSLAHFTMLKGKEKNRKVTVTDEVLRIMNSDVKLFYQELESGLEFQEFVPYLLPIFKSDNLEITGVESLMRWEKSGYRIIEAAKFRDIAEEQGVLGEIDMQIITKSLEAYETWRNKKLISENFTITINISMQGLSRLGIHEIIRCVDDKGIPRHYVEFDISEQTIQDKDSIDKIHKLHQEGFKFSLDAFGSNGTVLKSLLSMNLTTIKIDRALLPKTKQEIPEQAYYHKLIEVSKIFNLKTMAKGIETQSQLDMAKASKVMYYQGYYFTPPLNNTKILGFLNKYRNGIHG